MFTLRRIARALVGICAVPLLAAGPLAAPAAAQPVTPNGLVTQVVSGNVLTTFSIQRGWVHVRIFGVDVPGPNECYGPEGTAFAAQALTWQPVLLEADPRWPSADPTGVVTLAHVIRADGFNYGVEAVRAGVGRAVYVGQYKDQLAAAQKEAQDAKRGIWSPVCTGEAAPEPEAPANTGSAGSFGF